LGKGSSDEAPGGDLSAGFPLRARLPDLSFLSEAKFEMTVHLFFFFSFALGLSPLFHEIRIVCRLLTGVSSTDPFTRRHSRSSCPLLPLTPYAPKKVSLRKKVVAQARALDTSLVLGFLLHAMTGVLNIALFVRPPTLSKSPGALLGMWGSSTPVGAWDVVKENRLFFYSVFFGLPPLSLVALDS